MDPLLLCSPGMEAAAYGARRQTRSATGEFQAEGRDTLIGGAQLKVPPQHRIQTAHQPRQSSSSQPRVSSSSQPRLSASAYQPLESARGVAGGAEPASSASFGFYMPPATLRTRPGSGRDSGGRSEKPSHLATGPSVPALMRSGLGGGAGLRIDLNNHQNSKAEHGGHAGSSVHALGASATRIPLLPAGRVAQRAGGTRESLAHAAATVGSAPALGGNSVHRAEHGGGASSRGGVAAVATQQQVGSQATRRAPKATGVLQGRRRSNLAALARDDPSGLARVQAEINRLRKTSCKIPPNLGLGAGARLLPFGRSTSKSAVECRTVRMRLTLGKNAPKRSVRAPLCASSRPQKKVG